MVLTCRFPVLLTLCQMFSGLIAQHCSRQVSVYEMMLQRHIFKILIVETSNTLECLTACNDEKRCQSFNFVVSKNICEMNNRTKEARPEDFVLDSDRYYYGRVRNRVPLGSIPELPAESCKEIKASEGEQAVSGNYWFKSNLPKYAVLVHCDMKTEGKA
ncbi:unnamed protein product [Pocillopora meandrina]|uniref:Apple domain-containing protein n=1 Tax=Pocillopora meandrina TaxID=46732 RepID=A0AAU9Y539_9CNID|nr:unnamed protein product [Pocillopora meandrina]